MKLIHSPIQTTPHFLMVLVSLCLMSNALSATVTKNSWQPASSDRLQKIVDASVAQARAQFPDLQANELAVTLVDLREPAKPSQASYRGSEQIYPASVIKMFYLVAAHCWMEDGKMKDTEELRRAMRDMIVDSGNEPTHYVVDLLTGTTSGPELSKKEIEKWWDKRNAVNRYYTSLGFTNINVSKKPWCEGPYGREMQAIKLFAPKRNWLTTDATARLLSEIVTGRAVSKTRCEEMMLLLKRDPFSKSDNGDNQSTGFTGIAVPPGTKLWSKAGWTSETRHDAAYVELPSGAKFVLVTFTVNHASERQIIPTVAKTVIENMSGEK